MLQGTYITLPHRYTMFQCRQENNYPLAIDHFSPHGLHILVFCEELCEVVTWPRDDIDHTPRKVWRVKHLGRGNGEWEKTWELAGLRNPWENGNCQWTSCHIMFTPNLFSSPDRGQWLTVGTSRWVQWWWCCPWQQQEQRGRQMPAGDSYLDRRSL